MQRSSFLLSSASIAAAAWLQSTTLAFAESNAASSDPVLASLVRTVLPFEHERFPSVSAETVEERLESLFKLRSSAAFQASLTTFNHVERFSNGPTAHLSAPREIDASAYAASALPYDTLFTRMSSAQRIAYLRLWRSSAFNARRRFYTSIRAVTFVAFYSLDETWPRIGYGGPLLGREKI